ncbi:MAG: GxxExxY protein [Verrucomicrobiae bacterium]|nr:GxxExxY protein [Verrucomicrobiae bacterium]
MLFEPQTYLINGAARTVWRNLGYGFLEKIYENALQIELQEAGLSVETQSPIKVHYRGRETERLLQNYDAWHDKPLWPNPRR